MKRLMVVACLLLAACAGQAGNVAPKAGASFSGPIDMSEGASSATLSLTISQDGTSIASVAVTFTELKCEGFSAGSMEKNWGGPFSITDGSISASLSGGAELKGRFSSSTEASGTVKLVLEIPFDGTCDLGTSNWSANAD